MQSDQLMTEDQAIDALALRDRPNPRSALRWLCRTRKLAFIDVARGIRRFRPADLQAFIDRQRVTANTL